MGLANKAKQHDNTFFRRGLEIWKMREYYFSEDLEESALIEG